MTTLQSGRYGEEKAVQYLISNGYIIIARNFRSKIGEVDIIAVEKQSKTLVFVEVKMRSNNLFGAPSEAIRQKKLRALIKTAQFYQFTHRNLPENIRFDAIEVIKSSDGRVQIEHIKNITM